MTYTRAIGITFGAVIDRIVRWLALSRIHPNVLTFLGLVINIVAAFLFAAGDFRAAGLVVIGAGLFVGSGVVIKDAGPALRALAESVAEFDPDQIVISAQNRNFPGRSGPGQMYLASPLTVAASAVAGYIVEYEPAEVAMSR